MDEPGAEMGPYQRAFKVSLTSLFVLCALKVVIYTETQSTKYCAQNQIPLPNAVPAKETAR